MESGQGELSALIFLGKLSISCFQDVLGMSEWPSGVIVDPHTMEQVGQNETLPKALKSTDPGVDCCVQSSYSANSAYSAYFSQQGSTHSSFNKVVS